jgi:hypothetical protein
MSIAIRSSHFAWQTVQIRPPIRSAAAKYGLTLSMECLYALAEIV